ncbi:hypothetical protein DdX_06462 [Ditylenchus destructor]|uniref:Uncharacterized protein n=1 Tax=Ditylenchus destructor TaxID=166010 RepID=A0AAD4NAY7_9BILA|nr:hypothetical protein DdX_06462 [Ditylenchus destructor]
MLISQIDLGVQARQLFDVVKLLPANLKTYPEWSPAISFLLGNNSGCNVWNMKSQAKTLNQGYLFGAWKEMPNWFWDRFSEILFYNKIIEKEGRRKKTFVITSEGEKWYQIGLQSLQLKAPNFEGRSEFFEILSQHEHAIEPMEETPNESIAETDSNASNECDQDMQSNAAIIVDDASYLSDDEDAKPILSTKDKVQLEIRCSTTEENVCSRAPKKLYYKYFHSHYGNESEFEKAVCDNWKTIENQFNKLHTSNGLESINLQNSPPSQDFDEQLGDIDSTDNDNVYTLHSLFALSINSIAQLSNKSSEEVADGIVSYVMKGRPIHLRVLGIDAELLRDYIQIIIQEAIQGVFLFV